MGDAGHEKAARDLAAAARPAGVGGEERGVSAAAPTPPPGRGGKPDRVVHPRDAGDQEEAPARWRLPVALLFVVGLLVGAVLLIDGLKLNTRPGAHGAADCAAALPDDDLVHLAWRDEAPAKAQLTRWDRCDEQERDGDTLRERAVDALDDDRVLIVWLAFGLAVGCAVAWTRQRWHTAAKVGIGLTVAYVAADLYENHLLRGLVSDDRYDARMPVAAAVKIGALVGGAALLVVAVSLFAGGTGDPRRRGSRRTAGEFVGGWARRLGDTTRAAPVPGVAAQPTSDERGGLGISCSGGGVRSAAFSLGALQALDEETSEVAAARWMTAVSGGSYMATAWVTARDERPAAVPAPWSRRSPEEDHLRRHASYLAPGLGGKLWALCRFVFGFVVNLGVVVAAIAVVTLPVGWIIETAAEHRSVRGELELPSGACIQLGTGGHLVTVPGGSVHVTDGDLRVGPGVTVPPTDPSTKKASAEVEGEGRATVEVGDTPTASTTTTMPPADACTAAPADDVEPGDTPAAVQGQRFAARTKVPVVASSVVLSGRVAGCTRPQDDDPSDEPDNACAIEDASVVDLPAGSRLSGAARAMLTVDRAAYVEPTTTGDPRLLRACGERPCRSWDPAAWVWLAVVAPAVVALAIGIGLVTVRRTDPARRRLERASRRATVVAVIAAVAIWLVPTLVLGVEQVRGWAEGRLQLVGASTSTLLAALLAQLVATSGKGDSPSGKAVNLVKKVGGKLRPILVKLAAVVAGPLLLVGLALGFLYSGAEHGFSGGQLAVVLALLAVLVVFGLGGDLNEWSLHPFYREQLRRAFAVNPLATAPPFDALADPREDPLQHVNRAPGPELVICAAANIADDRLTAPGRPAVSWTFSRESIGSSAIGAATMSGTYPPSEIPDRFRHLASAWTAVAVSGAAFSPAMGKMSRPERMLFALGNLRLGVWYPNPRYHHPPQIEDPRGQPSFDWSWYETHHPRPWYLAKEALGLHRLRDPWVYVTDGGHYENLGLVELLRRRCTEIYCFDASGDSPETFGTLSDAMRIARSELEVELEIWPTPMTPATDDSGMSRLGVWPGLVRYPGSDEPGWIILAKLTVPRTAPFDIVDLARTLPAFPSHPTGDQLYTDQKFEAYRALGAHLGAQARMVGGAIRILVTEQGLGVEEAVRAVQRALCALPDPTPCPPNADGAPPEDPAAGAPG